MTKKENKPKIRFKGFTDVWEQRKAKELCSIETGSSNTQDQTSNGKYPFYIRSEYPVKSNKFLYDCEAVITIGDGKIGEVFHYVNGKFDLHQRCYKMADFKEIFGKYFYYFFSTKFYDRAMQMTAKATVDSVRLEMISEMEIYKPKTTDEQMKIANFLTSLDNLITLHQRKYEKFKNIKNALLEKMFPKNGSKLPEIRFKGFTNEWEKHKLGDLANIVGGGTPNTNISEYWEGNINWYTPAEIGEQIYLTCSKRKISELGYKNSSAKMLPIDTILFTSRAGIGKTAILSNKACTNQGFQSIIPDKSKLNSYFVFSLTDRLKKYGEVIGAGSTFVEVSGKQMSSMELLIPLYMKEQNNFGKLFKSLDNTIVLNKQIINKLKNIKKSLLEKMFV